MHGFTLVAAQQVSAPAVAEALAHLECRVHQTVPLGSEQAAVVLVVAEVVCAVIDDAVLESPRPRPPPDRPPRAGADRAVGRPHVHPHDPRRRVLPGALPVRSDTMKALLYEHPGGPDVLEYRDVADPEPGPLDVVVDVAATALNHLDVVQRNGWFTLPGFTLPHIAGMDVAGTVSSIGSDVDGIAVGDRVVVDPSLAGAPDGLEARRDGRPLRRARRDRRHRRRRLRRALPRARRPTSTACPTTCSWHAAAAFPTAYLTAHHALFEVGRPGGRRDGADPRRRQRRVGRRHPAGHATPARRCSPPPASDEKCVRATAIGAHHVANNRAGRRGRVGPRGHRRASASTWCSTTSARRCGTRRCYALAVRGRLVNCGNTTGDSGDDPVARLPVPHGHLDHRLRPYRPDEFGPSPGSSSATAASTSSIDSEFAARRRRRRRRRSCSATTSSARSSSSPEPPMADSPYPELKKTHTMARTGPAVARPQAAAVGARCGRSSRASARTGRWSPRSTSACSTGSQRARSDDGRARWPPSSTCPASHLGHLLDALVDVRVPRPGRRASTS